ncbi:MAG: YwbE family protein [Candidatus Magasanikbacteria bacterium]|nr:YwbE family protein [Candidatus Magasanikbacteria bacterium]
MPAQNRSDIYPGLEVEIILKADQKADQRTGALTRGMVAEILTNSATHPHGIKVRLTSGQVGRVQNIVVK